MFVTIWEAVITAQFDELSQADVGDLEKVMAVTTVITQSAISFLMTDQPSNGQQLFLGGLYAAIKFSAPAFIFGILFSTTRTHPQATIRNYPAFMRNRWHVLFVPSILWTAFYLLVMPQLQQHQHYHNWQEFCWQFVNGNAAPHLWYNVMMLQFIIIMPIFWHIVRWIQHRPYRGWLIGILSLIFEIGWYFLYASLLASHSTSPWYLLDRFCLSFWVFGIAGTLLWTFYRQLAPFLLRHWLAQLVCWLGMLFLIVSRFLARGCPVSLAAISYYRPAMMCFNFCTISMVATLLLYLQKWQSKWLPLVHWVALYAHRSYLGHICWLYWWWQGLRLAAPSLPAVLALPVLVVLTIATSFAFSYGAHLVWSWLDNQWHRYTGRMPE